MSRCIIYLVLLSVLFSQAKYNLYSPEIDLPAISDEETIHFGFWINIDMPDYSQTDNPSTPDVDESDYLADYYNIAISDVGASAWHSSDYNIDNGNNFWCADKEVTGYQDSWVQYLDTPSISVGNGGEFSSRIYYAIENTTGPFIDGSCTDGWDAANIRISSDGGSTWVLLEDPLNPYHFDCGYGWIYNDSKYDTDGSLNHLAKGWGGNSNIWVDFSADLSQYSDQEIIVRFAFGSDPELSTADDSSLTGFLVDNIIVQDDAGVLFSDSGDNMSQMIPTGEVWVDQFYDYGSCSAESPRPGCDEWEEYLPGAPFNEGANVLLNISDYAEKTVQFRIQTKYDDNHDGGQGAGLFIDDFKIYTFYSAVYYIPTNLNADPGNGEVVLTWEDMNASGTDDFDYSSDTFDDTLYTTSGTGWAGAIFDILGASTINTISIYNINADTTITIGAFSNLGATYDTGPKYQKEVALTTGWNDITVPNWEMQNDFIIAHQFNESFGAIFSTATYNTGDEIELHSRFRTSSTWEMPLWLLSEDDVLTGEILTGEFSIRANITYAGAGVTYNVNRDDENIASALAENTYIDSDVENNLTYEYAVSATYPDGGESAPSDSVSVTPMLSTVHELFYDDGSSESEFNAGSANFSAVRFTAGSSGEDIVRFKWFQNGSGGAFYIKVFEDEGGIPGAETYSAVQASGNMDGWNEKDLSQESLSVSGDFWVGVKEFSSSQPFGLDNSNSSNSYQRMGSTGDWNQVEGNLMYRVYLDCGDDCTAERQGRILSSWDDEIELTLSKPQPIYTLGFENKKLKRSALKLNGRQIFRIDNNSGFLSRLNRADEDEFPVVEYDFEDEASGWEYDSGWNLTTSNYHSPSHSFHSPNIEVCGIIEGGAVWPGNTNADSTVNVDDLLPIGMYWNQSVCERSELVNDVYTWEAQPLPESSCISHADSNGDGIVDIADILAIIVNWEKKTSNSDGIAYIVDNSCSSTETDLSRYYSNFQNIYNNLTGSSKPEIQMRHRLEELFDFSSVPNHYQIYQSYPNPFNPIASIPYFLPQESLVAVAVYNIVGQKVLTESAFVSTAGYHEIEIDGTELSSGVYFYQFIIDENKLTPMKMVLLK